MLNLRLTIKSKDKIIDKLGESFYKTLNDSVNAYYEGKNSFEYITIVGDKYSKYTFLEVPNVNNTIEHFLFVIYKFTFNSLILSYYTINNYKIKSRSKNEN